MSESQSVASLFWQDALAALETPRGPDQRMRKLSTPLSEVIGRNLKLALANSSRQAGAHSASPQLTPGQPEAVGNLVVCRLCSENTAVSSVIYVTREFVNCAL